MALVLKRQIKGIPVLEVVAENARHEPLPLVVYYHGWRSAKELVLTQARKLAQAGMRVVLQMRLIMVNGCSQYQKFRHGLFGRASKPI